jgi:LPXTG-motif cell wall-anchored protein
VVLQPGDATTCTATYTPVQADIDSGQITNTATATGTPLDGLTPPTSAPSTSTVTTSPHPALSLLKTASAQRVTTVGQVVTYTFAITNTGNVDVSNPKVNEGTFTGHGTLSAVTCPGDSVLPPGQMISCAATYTVVAADLADGGNLSNTATVTGTTPGGDLLTSDPSTAKVKEVAPATPALASTGSNIIGWATGGLALLGAGLALALFRRRRMS